MKVHQVIKSILTNNMKPAIVRDLFTLEDKLQNQNNNPILLDN